MSTRPVELDRRPRAAPPAGSAPSLADCTRALIPVMGRTRRWSAAVVAAWIVGAVAGVAPTAFQGYRAPGLVASAMWGLVAVALLAPLVITPIVATVVCDDDHHQVAYAWHGVGVSPVRRMLARTVAAARVSLGLLLVGAVAGLAAGVGLAASGRDPLVFGWSGAPGPVGIAVGAAVLLLAWTIGGLLAAVAVAPARALLALVLSWLITGVVASLVHFSPQLGLVFRLTPWAALWPFDPGSSDSAQFAAAIPLGARLVGAAGWLAILAATAAWRRRLAPYPGPGERRRRH